MSETGESPDSPCIGTCQLDAGQVCIGCGRRIEDIMAWPNATARERRVIVEAARRRLLLNPDPDAARVG